MKLYFTISVTLFIMMFIGLMVFGLIRGFDARVPFYWNFVLGAISINSIAAIVVFAVDILRS